MKATFFPYILNFKQPAGTSRGVLLQKETYFLIVEKNGKIGIGECGLFKGLSFDDVTNYTEKLRFLCANIHLPKEELLKMFAKYPSIIFGLEQALLSLKNENNSSILFQSAFTRGEQFIPINGLIWMGDVAFMKQQIKAKISQGFSCIKLKVGALDFETEYKLLKEIRQNFFSTDIEIRLDANGGFSVQNALERLQRLSHLHIHSIEQPIRQHQQEEMARLCELSPIAIALDEELIGVINPTEKQQLLKQIAPQYIILKPTLVGGYSGSLEWIKLAEENKINWWITSALESNVGLNAIAQWTHILNNPLQQGLGTGGLYTNNFESPLVVKNGALYFDNKQNSNFHNKVLTYFSTK